MGEWEGDCTSDLKLRLSSNPIKSSTFCRLDCLNSRFLNVAKAWALFFFIKKKILFLMSYKGLNVPFESKEASKANILRQINGHWVQYFCSQ